MRRGLVLMVLVILSAPLTIPASAQPSPEPAQDGYDWSGRLSFPERVTIAAGETLRVAPGTVIEGAGRIQVEGSLVVEGRPEAPVDFHLPVHLVGQGSSTFEHARFTGVNATALNVSSGEATLSNVTFSANSRALRVADHGRVVLRGANVTDHVGEAVYAEGSASVEVSGSTFSRNGRGLAVYSAARLDISGSRFVGNEQHLVLDLWPWSVAGVFTLSDNEFLAPTPGAAPLPALHLRHDGSLAEDQPRQLVRLSGNRVEGAPIGLRAEGRGLIVESEDDVFAGNQLGVSVQLASVTLRRTTFDNARDVEGTVVLVDAVTRRDGAPVALVVEDASNAWLPWALGGIALVVVVTLGVVVVGSRRARSPASAPAPLSRETPRQPSAAPSRASQAAAEPGPEAVEPAPSRGPRRVDLATPITSLERRILEDILAHPGTSQRAVADRLGYTRQALHYHVKRLEARGLVEKTIEGRETRCAVPPEVAQALSTPAVTQTGSQEKA